jgi:hypothetical protein
MNERATVRADDLVSLPLDNRRVRLVAQVSTASFTVASRICSGMKVTGTAPVLHGIQAWVALPEAVEETSPIGARPDRKRPTWVSSNQS